LPHKCFVVKEKLLLFHNDMFGPGSCPGTIRARAASKLSVPEKIAAVDLEGRSKVALWTVKPPPVLATYSANPAHPPPSQPHPSSVSKMFDVKDFFMKTLCPVLGVLIGSLMYTSPCKACWHVRKEQNLGVSNSSSTLSTADTVYYVSSSTVGVVLSHEVRKTYSLTCAKFPATGALKRPYITRTFSRCRI
jgi:hypothetical protein